MNPEIFVVIVRSEAGRYRARFPDFPGLGAEGDTLASLIDGARHALEGELRRRESAGEEWPKPSTLEDVHSQVEPGVDSLMLVDVPVDDRPVRVNISIGERLLKRLDEMAAAKDMSRSGYIAASVRRSLGSDFAGRANASDARSQSLRDEIAAVGRKVNEALGPESAFGRTLYDLDARALAGLRSLATLVRAQPRGWTPPESDPTRKTGSGGQAE